MISFILQNSKLVLTCCTLFLSTLVLFGLIPGHFDQICRTILVGVSLLCMTALVWRYIGNREVISTYRHFDSDFIEQSCLYHSENGNDDPWRVSSN